MNKTLCSLFAAAAIGAALPAQAIRVVDVSTAGASTVLDFSAPGLLAVDIDLRDRAPLLIRFEIEAGDLGAAIDFNAVIRNLSAGGLEFVSLGLDRGAFAQAGTVTRFFGGDSQLSGGGAQWRIDLSPAEYFDLELGDAFGSSPGAQNWRLDGSGWQLGDQVLLAVAVPEPASAALLLGGLGLLGSLARRRAR